MLRMRVFEVYRQSDVDLFLIDGFILSGEHCGCTGPFMRRNRIGNNASQYSGVYMLLRTLLRRL